MVESALDHARILEDLDFHEYKISVKASDVFLTVAAYQRWPKPAMRPAPRRHGGGRLAYGHGEISIGMGALLWAGIGDTIRVSLSADPVEEVKVGFDILKSLGLRTRGVNIIACPLRAAGLRRHQDGRGAGTAAGAHFMSRSRCPSSAAW
jgi:(E)-4-hydroxy-3-methylbut-2-enyl-diphosphate synthase